MSLELRVGVSTRGTDLVIINVKMMSKFMVPVLSTRKRVQRLLQRERQIQTEAYSGI